MYEKIGVYMVEVLRPEDIASAYSKAKWVSPYSKILAMVDREARVVEVHEFHARNKCVGGAAWEVYHYPRASSLVLSARREGARNVFVFKIGRGEVSLEPGVRGAGVEEVRIEEGEVKITYVGLVGGGVAATLCRGMAEGVCRVEIHERGGGARVGRASLVLPLMEKLSIGVDDTDVKEAGATWALLNEIAYSLELEGKAYYINHVITQLYTRNPHKTTNCVSIGVSFAVNPSSKEGVLRDLEEMLRKHTLSSHTGLAYMNKVLVPARLRRYGVEAKSRLLTLEDAYTVAEEVGVGLKPVTGERGLIGALAALSFIDDPDEAVKVYA